MISVCLELNVHDFPLSDGQLELKYQEVIKPLLTHLFTNPKLCFSFAFSGPQVEWLKNEHPEALVIIKDLINRHQVEVLGGGFYSPILSLIYPEDKSGQIERFTTLIRGAFGKRARGMVLYGDIWDPVLITTIKSCGMEYIQLDNTIVNQDLMRPIVMNDQDKAIKIFQTYSCLVPNKKTKDTDWKNSLYELKKKSPIQDNSNVAVVKFNFEEMEVLLSSKVFSFMTEISNGSQDEEEIVFTTPQEYLKKANEFTKVYVPASMNDSIKNWTSNPYELIPTESPVTIYDYLRTYSNNNKLYQRMLYVGMLYKQSSGDKARKVEAREMMWKAQCGSNFINPENGMPSSAEVRQKAFSAFSNVEKLIRNYKELSESLTSYDYNMDGINEYVCQMDAYHTVISTNAGAITELDVISGGGNYAANLHRMKYYDGQDDSYSRHIFSEHLYDDQQYQDYLNDENVTDGIFSKLKFVEKRFDTKRKEIQMEARGEFSSLQQPVKLKKIYLITSSGLSVQYILKNDSPFALHGTFVVESNFTQTSFDVEKCQFDTNIVYKGEKVFNEESKDCQYAESVSLVQVMDNVNKISFVFEPNEDASFNIRNIKFFRPTLLSKPKTYEASKSVATSFVWNVDLAAGMEMEKTVNLGIVPAKK